MAFTPYSGTGGELTKGGVTVAAEGYHITIGRWPTALVALTVGDGADLFAEGDEVAVAVSVWESTDVWFGFPSQAGRVAEAKSGHVVVRVDQLKGPDFYPAADKPTTVVEV